VVGVIDKRTEPKSRCDLPDGKPDPFAGLACHPERRITVNDRIILVGKNAFPTRAPASKCASDDGMQNDQVQSSQSIHNGREPFDILICGWREEWSNDMGLFRRRLDGITNSVPHDSRVMFLNRMGHDQFNEIMAKALAIEPSQDCVETDVTFEPGEIGFEFSEGGKVTKIIHSKDVESGWEFVRLKAPDDFEEKYTKQRLDELIAANAGFSATFNEEFQLNQCYIAHEVGDPGDFGVLQKTMRNTRGNKYEAAVVMGTVVGASLAPASRDRRVLSTMILLRKAHNEVHPGTSLHIVGENMLDFTADLVRAGSTSHVESQGDFVNTQGVYAMVLAQALAYPLVHPALAQLYTPRQDNPELLLAPVGSRSLPGLQIPLGEASFAQVTEIVMKFKEASAKICLGYRTEAGELVFAPPPGAIHNYEKGDKLILIIRKTPEYAELSRLSSKPRKQKQRMWRQSTKSN